MRERTPAVKTALAILRGQAATPEEVRDLSKKLKAEEAFGYARRILAPARLHTPLVPALKRRLTQQYALCTYKDQDLPLVSRLDTALEVLKNELELPTTTDQETLGLAGAIYKRKWHADGQKINLELSLKYYRRGYQAGPAADQGYTGINAAFILDLLAWQEDAEAAQAGAPASLADQYRQEARRIREALVAALTPNVKPDDWWLLVTIAEAYFGLGQYEEAKRWLTEAKKLSVPDWQLETTARQLAHLATLQNQPLGSGPRPTAAGEILLLLADSDPDAFQTAVAGKVGLALSGGGFRASLYHIGVLARLAELDMLRHVEVLSCVSGGSIIGAYYYLELRHLLQTVADEQITQQHYLDIVERISTNFLRGVQRNIRTRVINNWWTDVKMLFLPNYSRTNRAGELYERELYASIADDHPDPERWMDELTIHPKNAPVPFNVKYDNWRRRNKVPILILNATALNTGHNWQFTATWMGEPPASIQRVDGNYRLRRMYYQPDGPPEQRRRVRLGEAVAASACVPGLFEPLNLPKFYPNIVVKLVDGGVHDNQGICGLLEQDCAVLLVSDASGQMSADDHPSSSLWGVPMRANDILMERVRNAQYQDLATRTRNGVLKGLLFIHLKLDLEAGAISWLNCDEPAEHKLAGTEPTDLTRYGIRRDVQARLAAIRTDLDSFHNVEAWALMASGYAMTRTEFNSCIKGFSTTDDVRHSWAFTDMVAALGDVDFPTAKLELLEVAREKFFKVFRLNRVLFGVAVGVGVIALAVLAYLAFTLRARSLITVGAAATRIGWLLAALVLGNRVVNVLNIKSTLLNAALRVMLVTVGWIGANVHLWLADRLYLRLGKK